MKIIIPSKNADNLKFSQALSNLQFEKPIKRHALRVRLLAVAVLLSYFAIAASFVPLLENRISSFVASMALLAFIVALSLLVLVMALKWARAKAQSEMVEQMNVHFPDGTPIELSIDGDGLKMRTLDYESIIRWEGVYAIEPMKRVNATAILHSRLSTIIPHSVFASESEYTAFIDELHSHWKRGT